MDYTYDKCSNTIITVSGSDVIREYSYDSLGRISKIKDHKEPGSAAFFETTYTYDDHSRVSYRRKGNSGGAFLPTGNVMLTKKSHIH